MPQIFDWRVAFITTPMTASTENGQTLTSSIVMTFRRPWWFWKLLSRISRGRIRAIVYRSAFPSKS